MAATKILDLLDNSGNPLGVINNAKARKTVLPIRGSRSTTFSVRLDNPATADLLTLARLVRVRQRRMVAGAAVFDLLGVLPLLAADEAVSGEDEGIVTITAADPLASRLTHRLVGKATVAAGPTAQGVGKGIGYTQGTPLAPVDTGTIAKGVIDVTNAADGFTGVATSGAWITASANRAVGPWYYKPVSECIIELSAPLDSFEYQLRPTDPVDIGFGAAKPKICEFVAAPFIGTDRHNDVFFEYGQGKRNVTGYSRPRTVADLLNRGYTLPSGYPDTAAQLTPGTPDPVTGVIYGDTYQTVIANALDASASIAAWGVHEGVVSENLIVDLFRQKLADEHVRIRMVPREQITFQLAANIEYTYGVHYFEGDLVTGRATVNGQLRYDATFRIYQVELSDDDQGNEQVAVTLVPS